MGTYKEVDGLRYTMEQLQNSGEKDQFPTGKGDLVASFKYIEDYMNQNCHPNTTLGAALHGDGLLTDHGVEHVKMVIQNAGKLVGDMQYKRLNGYEIYLLLLAIHFHDVGNVCGRQEHEKKIDDIITALGDRLPLDTPEKVMVSDIATAHGGYADIDHTDKDTLRHLSLIDNCNGIIIRPALLGAILRFADELSDDSTRANRYLNATGQIPSENMIFLENRHAPYLINEHFLVLNLLMYSLLDLSVIEYPVYEPEAYKNFFENTYSRYLQMSGCKDKIKVDYESPKDFFLSLYHHAEEMQADFIGYILRLNPNSDKLDPAYDLPLLSFLRFVVPVFKDLINLPGFRQNANIYFFIDDADNLSITQTKILNTWIACRTQPTISLKVSAQYELYKTYLTSNDILIESPHDYQSVNISLRYTTNYIGKFKDKAIEILAKRLSSAGIEQPPEKFFPTYSIQEDGIQREIQLIRDNYTISGRGTRVDDDIRRYAIPNYIKKLGGTKKSRSTFRYAGLENIS